MDTLPDIANEAVFALKGGTAINLFHGDMPRLSVDIDRTCLPLANRQSSLKGIDDALDRIMATIARRFLRHLIGLRSSRGSASPAALR